MTNTKKPGAMFNAYNATAILAVLVVMRSIVVETVGGTGTIALADDGETVTAAGPWVVDPRYVRHTKARVRSVTISTVRDGYITSKFYTENERTGRRLLNVSSDSIRA